MRPNKLSWKARREQFKKRSGQMSNPNDGRARSKERRAMKRSAK